MTPKDLDGWLDVLFEQTGKAVIVGIFIHSYLTTGKLDAVLLSAVASLTAGINLAGKLSASKEALPIPEESGNDRPAD